ncbi:hypothetical protein K7X08_025899 [Anisodus acutangulus]|uniref:RRM domain-containing protein n=1 Tax=Anisodus acutangulus TaxID=402998 RepID=A0A9Q1N1P2_9SOLA|nr:hypothetical protein K7X08_025899 [Anisodus acutangulus]
MQHDEVIWQVIRHKHCSFMAKIETGIFCRNPYNVTGICNRSSCPLANSRYATIRDHDGVFYLYMKTIERAHMPNKLWERVKLPRNYEKALEIIDKHLMYWPKFLVHKAKQRLTKMTQMRIRMRKLALKTREKIMTTPRKETKRESRRQEKAEKAALLDKSIEKELLERLSKGVYGDIYNYPEQKYQEILDREALQMASEEEDEEEPEVEYVEGYEDLEEEDDMEDFDGLGIRNNGLDDDTGMDDDDDDDDEEAVTVHRKSGRKDSALARRRAEKDDPSVKSKKKAKVLVEVEHDDTGARQTALCSFFIDHINSGTMRRRSYSPSPPRGYGRRGRSPSPRGRYGGRSRDAPTSLLVRNLRHDCRPEDLRRPFGQFGPVKDIYLPRDYYTGEPRGFGFVQFVDPDDAAEAKYQMDGQGFQGRQLTVVFAEENRKKPTDMRARERSGSGRSSRSYDRRRTPPRYSLSPPSRYARSHSRGYYAPKRRQYSRSVSPEEKRYSHERSYSRSPARDVSPPPYNGSRSRSQTPVRERSPYDNGPRSRSKSPVRERSLVRANSRCRSRSPGRSRSRSPDGVRYLCDPDGDVSP